MRHPTRWFVLLALLVMVALVAAACPAPAPTAAPASEQPAAPAEATAAPAAPAEPAAPTPEVKAAFVYVSAIGDKGWTYSHDVARLILEEELGIQTAFVENVPEGPDAERVIRDFAEKGYNPIITTSFGFMDPTINVAKEYQLSDKPTNAML